MSSESGTKESTKPPASTPAPTSVSASPTQTHPTTSAAPTDTTAVSDTQSSSHSTSQPPSSSAPPTSSPSSSPPSSRFVTSTTSSGSSTPPSSTSVATSSSPSSSPGVTSQSEASTTSPVFVSAISTSTVFITTTAPRTSTPTFSVSGTGKFTYTSIFASTDSSGATHTITQVIARQTDANGKVASSNGFLQNSGAVAGVSVVAGVIGAGIIAILILTCLRKRKNKRLDRDAWDAAQMSYAGHATSDDGHGRGHVSSDSHGSMGEPPMVTVTPLHTHQQYPAPVFSATGHILDDEFNDPQPGRRNVGAAGGTTYPMNYGNASPSSASGPGVAGFGAGGNHRPRNNGNGNGNYEYNYVNTPNANAIPMQQRVPGSGYATYPPPSTNMNTNTKVPPADNYLVNDPFGDSQTSLDQQGQGHGGPQRTRSRSSKHLSVATSVPSVYSNDHDDDDDQHDHDYHHNDHHDGALYNGPDSRLDPNAVDAGKARRAAFANAGPTGSAGSGYSLRDDKDYSRKILR